MSAWYTAKTKPRQENQTSAVLQQRGIDVFLPRIAVWKGGLSPSAVTKLEPLFPGYIFARMNLCTTDWLQARSAPGVSYFLGTDDVPTPLSDELIEGIRSRVETQRRSGWQPRFRPGDPVVITGGPLAGLEAVFDGRLSASGRSRVFVTLVSRLVPVVVAGHQLRAAG